MSSFSWTSTPGGYTIQCWADRVHACTGSAKAHEVQTFSRRQSVPGIGQILALVLLYEMQDLARFPRVQDFVSYGRLVKCAKESGGKRLGTSGKKSGNVHWRWAFAAAAVLFVRQSQPGKAYFAKLDHKHGKAQALTVLAHKLGRAVDSLLTREHAVDLNRVVTASPLRGETEPIAYLAHPGLSLWQTPSFYTAPTVRESLADTPDAAGFAWTVSLAHLRGDSSPGLSQLPLHRVCDYLGAFSDTTRRCEQTGMRAQKRFSDVAPAGATVLRTEQASTATLQR